MKYSWRHKLAMWLAPDLLRSFKRSIEAAKAETELAHRVRENFQRSVESCHVQMEKMYAHAVRGAATPEEELGLPMPAVADMPAVPYRRHVFITFHYSFNSKVEAENVANVLQSFIYEVVAKFVDVFERLPPTVEQRDGFVAVRARYAFAGPLNDKGPRTIKGCDFAYYEEAADGTKFTDINEGDKRDQ